MTRACHISDAVQKAAAAPRRREGRCDQVIRLIWQVWHAFEFALHTENNRQQVGEIMRQSAG